jgi:hypothetical protein
MPPIFDPKEAAAAVKRRAVEPAMPIGPSPEREAVRRITASSAAAALPSLAMGGAPAAGGLAQTGMDEDAEKIWKTIKHAEVKSVDPAKKEGKVRLAALAMGRLLSLPEGAALVKQLGRIFGDRQALQIRFVDKLEKDVEKAGGYATPESAGAAQYSIFIKNQPDIPGNQWVDWPSDKAARVVTSWSTDAVSGMAMTLFHELLHVWFMNTHNGVQYPTGHGEDVGAGEFDDDFWNRLVKFSEEQDILTRKKP